jgi:hypothetical protein
MGMPAEECGDKTVEAVVSPNFLLFWGGVVEGAEADEDVSVVGVVEGAEADEDVSVVGVVEGAEAEEEVAVVGEELSASRVQGAG